LKKFPDDKLISPLINQHLAYINTYQNEMLNRNAVLADDDPHEVPFTLTPAFKQQTEYRKPYKAGAFAVSPGVKVQDKKQDAVTTKPQQPANVTPQPGQPVVKPANTTQSTQLVVSNVIPPTNTTLPNQAVVGDVDQPVNTAPNQPAIKKPVVSSIFSMRDSTDYYFVVNVSSGTTNLASSRFGIGQFNRANFAGNGIKHQLMNVESNNQLIFVGRFLTLESVKKYARQIVPLLPEIMKVPKDKYSFFIITQENLNKLADKKTLDSYFDFYQQNY
jgi:hypothetical protein